MRSSLIKIYSKATFNNEQMRKSLKAMSFIQINTICVAYSMRHHRYYSTSPAFGAKEIKIHIALWFDNKPLLLSVLSNRLQDILANEARDLIIYIDLINVDKSGDLISQSTKDLIDQKLKQFTNEQLDKLFVSEKEAELASMHLAKICDLLTRASQKYIVVASDEEIVNNNTIPKVLKNIIDNYNNVNGTAITFIKTAKKVSTDPYYINFTKEDYLALQFKSRTKTIKND